jgi:hypothetical protein
MAGHISNGLRLGRVVDLGTMHFLRGFSKSVMIRLATIALIYVVVLVIAWATTCNDTVVQTVAVALTGLVIIWYTHETYLLRVETQKQTELSQRPLVLAELSDKQFAVTNYGHGVAFNVSIKPVTVDEKEQIFIQFKDAVPILKSQEAKIIGAESFHKGTSTGDFFNAHLNSKYTTQDMILEVEYQNAELQSYVSREKISPQKREILEFKTIKT